MDIYIRVLEDNFLIIYDNDTAIDANDCCEIKEDFNKLTVSSCLHHYENFIKERR